MAFPTDKTTGPGQTTPPPEPELPKSKAPTHVVKEGETLDSIAKDHGVTTQELAAANGLGADATVEPHQTLELPSNAKMQGDDSAAGLTPQQRTDAAYQKYQTAQQTLANDRKSPAGKADVPADQTAVAQAKREFEDAVEAEIAAKIAQVNTGVPPQYQTPEAQLIQQFQAQIAARHSDDPAVQPLLDNAAGDYQTEQTAQSLIPYYSGDFSAADKLKGIDLTDQPQAVIDKVLADPRVQQWIKEAADDIAKPYDGKSQDDILYKTEPAEAASGKLYQTVDGLPPALEQAVVKASMPTIQKIAQLNMYQLGGAVPFSNVQDVVSMLGTGSEADAVVAQVAKAFIDGGAAPQLNNSSFVTDPKLGMEMARQLSDIGGKANEIFADGIVRSLESAAQNAKSVLDNDIKTYSEATAELNFYIKSLGPSMTPAQKQAAIDDYMKSKGEDWQKEVEGDKNRIVADAKKLDALLTALHDPPAGLPTDTADGARAVAKTMGEDESTQQAIEFAASQDPTLFAGEEGESAAKFWVEVGHKSKDFTAAVAQSYVAGHVLPELKGLNPNDPASVAKVRQVLEDLRGNATLLGVDKKVLDEGINKLETLVDSLKTETLQDAINGKGINAIGEVKKELSELGTLSSGPTGLLFRTIAFGLTGSALINAAGETAENPNLQNLINDVGLTLGFTQDSAALAAKVGLIDKAGSLGGWGLRTSPLGEATERFVGALGVAYYLLGAGAAAVDKDAPAAAFNLAAAAGIGIATFVDASWAGPVGWGIALVSVFGLGWYEHVKDANKYEPGNDDNTVPFLKHAGFNDAAAHELANQTGDGVSPVTLLVQYARDKGYDMSDPAQQKAVVDWINNMPIDQLKHVRDWFNNSLDELGGDASKLGTDTTVVWPTKIIVAGNYPAEVLVTPTTVGELDAMMKNYGATPLPPI